MKIIEVNVGEKSWAWEANDTTKIAKKENIVTVTFDHPEKGKMKTVIDLLQVPVYTFG